MFAIISGTWNDSSFDTCDCWNPTAEVLLFSTESAAMDYLIARGFMQKESVSWQTDGAVIWAPSVRGANVFPIRAIVRATII